MHTASYMSASYNSHPLVHANLTHIIHFLFRSTFLTATHDHLLVHLIHLFISRSNLTTGTHTEKPSHSQKSIKTLMNRHSLSLSPKQCGGRTVAGGQQGLRSVNRLPLIRDSTLWMQKPMSAFFGQFICGSLIRQACKRGPVLWNEYQMNGVVSSMHSHSYVNAPACSGDGGGGSVGKNGFGRQGLSITYRSQPADEARETSSTKGCVIKPTERRVCHEKLGKCVCLRLTSAKNASIPPIPPSWCAPGPPERRHRLRSPVRESPRRKVERVCRDQWRVAVSLWWWFPIHQAFILSSEMAQ